MCRSIYPISLVGCKWFRGGKYIVVKFKGGYLFRGQCAYKIVRRELYYYVIGETGANWIAGDISFIKKKH